MTTGNDTMIDLHSHILPGIDDGPETLEESIELASLYEKHGFTQVVATPHWIPGTFWAPSINSIYNRLDSLNDSIKKQSMAIRVLAGMEIAMDPHLADLLANKQLLTLAGGPYVLVETPFQRLPAGWKQMIFQIIGRGFRVILAHPERCRHFSSNPELLDEITEAGVYLQANYDSFLGNYGHKVAKLAFYLLEKGFLHLLATDSHDSFQRHPGNIHNALNVLNKSTEGKGVEILTHVNPQRVIKGLKLKTVNSIVLLPKSRKKWWFF